MSLINTRNLMAVTESQLQNRWSNRGSITNAKKTHESIRTALGQHDWPSGFSYEPYLQGSYRNHTNIYGDSDVDIVVELTSIFQKDLSGLTEAQKAVYRSRYSTASKTLADFRQHVVTALRDYYNDDFVFSEDRITQKDKCIEVDTPYLDADVVVCQSYRLYYSTDDSDPEGFRYIPGISFQTLSRRRIINFPKVHYSNGTTKHQNTSNRFKALVRCFKNARSYLTSKGKIPKDLAPSYFIECLVYNAPNSCFTPSYLDSYKAVLGHFDDVELGTLRTQDGVLPLFGTTDTTWSVDKAERMIDAWNNLLNG